jgi:hypothetical protein
MTRHVPPQNKKGPDVKHLPSNADKAIDKYSARISFSFHFLNHGHDKFNANSKKAPYFIKLIERLKNISGIEKSQLITYSNKALRCHLIKWERTTEKGFGIPNEDVIVEEPMQFNISVNEHGRIHGFFIGNVFYIVWLDPDHKLYSNEG